MTTPPLDLPALRDIANAATEGPWHALELPDVIGNCTSTIHAPNAMDVPTWSDIAPEIAGALKGGDAAHIAAFDPPTVLRLLDRLEAAERDLAAVTVSRDGWQPRAEAAEKAVAAVRELHQPVGAYVNPGRHERLIKVCAGCGLVDGAWQKHPCPTITALDGEHTKQLGGTPTGEFADVCSCGKSYWPCDSLDGGA